ncbi:unnamed protein product [Strongylus vulgaris]|uniref:glucuronosyltransferase n=1 Tax=Strongylus vulgaris TaxID=40348 RepID=A0A3P7JTP8_STRVU|nr:unnamed protein product [Strongylus vulgaris]
MPSLTIALTLSALLAPTVALNILVWSSTMGQSHINFIGNIADTLREDGHNVTLLFVEFDPDFKVNTGTKHVEHIIRYSSPYHNSADWRSLTFKRGIVFNSIFGFNFIDLIKIQIYVYRVCKGMLEDPGLIQLLHDSKFDLGIFEMFHSCPAGVMELAGMLEDPRLIQLLRDSKFDLGIFEMFHSCPAGVMELAGTPKTMMVSAIGIGYHHYRLLGMERQSSFVPASLTMCGGRMNFLERLYNIFINGSGQFLQNFRPTTYSFKVGLNIGFVLANIFEYFEQSLFESKFPGFKSLHDLIKAGSSIN